MNQPPGQAPGQPQTVASLDEAMRLAIELSYKVKGTTYPNPPTRE